MDTQAGAQAGRDSGVGMARQREVCGPSEAPAPTNKPSAPGECRARCNIYRETVIPIVALCRREYPEPRFPIIWRHLQVLQIA